MSKRIITINRLYGSNGRQLGQILAQIWAFIFDKN